MAKEKDITKRVSVYNKYKGRCAYCGNKIKYEDMHLDHITPKYRGSTNTELSKYNIVKGKDSIENFNPSCGSCNCSKSTFTIENWRNELLLKHDRLIRDNSSYRIINRFGIVKIKNEITFYFEKVNI